MRKARPVTQTMTGDQNRYYSYLYFENERQSQCSYLEWSSYPQFILNCWGCTVELQTTNCETARAFIEDHAGHRTTFETNQRPDAIVYDNKQEVLEQLAIFGKYLVKEQVPEMVIKNARLTYKFIYNGGDTEGGLKRLMKVCLFTEEGHCHTTEFMRLWLKSIIYQDKKFLGRAKRWFEREGKENNNGSE